MTEDLKQKSQELGMALTKGAIGTATTIAAIAHPELAVVLAGAPFLTEALAFFPNRKAQKVEILLNDLAKRMGVLENRDKFWETFESIKLSDLLKYVLEKSADADSEEKIKIFSQILYNGITHEDVNAATIRSVVEYVSSLNEIQLAIVHAAHEMGDTKAPLEIWRSKVADIINSGRTARLSEESRKTVGYNIYMQPMVSDSTVAGSDYEQKFFTRSSSGIIRVSMLGELVFSYID